ncbi:MAG: class I SAM-dependent methyltransferase [Thermodesulfobacteriota bacterium]
MKDSMSPSRSPVSRDNLKEERESPKRLNTPEGALKVFAIYFDEMRTHSFEPAGKTVLNIGAGDLIGLDVLFLLFGARRVVSVDLNPGRYLYPHLGDQRLFFEELASLIPSMGYGPLVRPWDDIIERRNGRPLYNRERLARVTPCDAASLPLREGCVDFAFSNAVLEHVGDPEGVIREVARTLSPGGHTMHRVDLRDHRDFSRPLEFLKSGESNEGCNLWRACRFERAFRGQLEVQDFVVFDSCRVTDAQRDSFGAPFRSLSCEELGKLRFMVYATKSGHTPERRKAP